MRCWTMVEFWTPTIQVIAIWQTLLECCIGAAAVPIKGVRLQTQRLARTLAEFTSAASDVE
jgi:hypothetical protein